MRTNQTELRWPAIAGVVLWMAVCPGVISARQEEQRGRVEVGVRQISGDPTSSKFSEYRSIPRGLYIQRFELNLNDLLNDRYFFAYQARETLEKDQSHLLSAGYHGKYRFQLRWDQTPHVFTNKASTFFIQQKPGVYTVPAQIRATLETSPGLFSNLLDQARPIDVSLRRNTGGGAFVFTPTSNWNFDLGYSREKQTGTRPFGTAMNAFANSTELPEPIDYRTHQFRAGGEYAARNWGIQFGYSGSIFKNRIGELVWDNAFRTTDTATASSRGRIDLYPDNTAHNLNVAVAFNLPKETRFMGGATRGWMRQNDAFLPFTINPAVTGAPQLPASSPNGRKQTLALNATLTNQAIPNLSLTTRYRSYDYNNETTSLIFSNYVRTDAGLGGFARRNLPYAYNRQNAGLDAVLSFLEKNAIKLSYEWEQLDREHRDVHRSNEDTFGASLDLNPLRWLLLRTSYRRSERTPAHYEANEESFPLGEGPFALGQIDGLRKLDEAQRTRDRTDALIRLDFTDAFSLSGSFGVTDDRYKETRYGLLNNADYSLSFDAVYNVHPSFGIFAEYARERYRYDMRSRQRVPATATAAANDTTNNDWASYVRDVVDTWGAGFDGSITDHKIEFETFYSLSAAKGSLGTRALGIPGTAGFLVTTAGDYPGASNRFHQLAASVKFLISSNLNPKFEYRFEKYDRIDFQIDKLRPNMSFLDPAANTSIFLGANVPGYRTHIFAVALEYRF